MECVETRENILDEIKRELLGPGSEDICENIEEEVITDSPIQRYSVGILYPQKNTVDENKGDDFDKNDELHEDEEDEEVIREKNQNENILEENGYIPKEELVNDLDQEISMANQYLPSSMGMTFFVKANRNKINLNIKYAKYRAAKVSDCHVKYDGEDFFTGTELERYLEKKEGDTAFKRRWSFEYIDIDEGEKKIEEIVVGLGENKRKVKWNKLRHKINERLISLNVNEDKLLGPFFLSLEELQSEDKFDNAFKSKLLMYLYEDVLRYKKDEFFNITKNKELNTSTYSKLIKSYDKFGGDIFDFELDYESPEIEPTENIESEAHKEQETKDK